MHGMVEIEERNGEFIDFVIFFRAIMATMQPKGRPLCACNVEQMENCDSRKMVYALYQILGNFKISIDGTCFLYKI